MTPIIAEDQKEMSFHEKTIAREIARDDAWLKEAIRQRAEERRRQREEMQSGTDFPPEEKAA